MPNFRPVEKSLRLLASDFEA